MNVLQLQTDVLSMPNALMFLVVMTVSVTWVLLEMVSFASKKMNVLLVTMTVMKWLSVLTLKGHINVCAQLVTTAKEESVKVIFYLRCKRNTQI